MLPAWSAFFTVDTFPLYFRQKFCFGPHWLQHPPPPSLFLSLHFSFLYLKIFHDFYLKSIETFFHTHPVLDFSNLIMKACLSCPYLSAIASSQHSTVKKRVSKGTLLNILRQDGCWFRKWLFVEQPADSPKPRLLMVEQIGEEFEFRTIGTDILHTHTHNW